MAEQNNVENNNNNQNNANVDNNFGRELDHDPDAFWTSSGKPLWDSVMTESGLTFDNIGWEDMEADNSIAIMKTFVNSCRRFPPLRQNGREPYGSDTVVKAFNTGTLKLKSKFRNEINSNPGGEYFPDDVTAKWRKELKKNRVRNTIEADDETDLHRGTYPLPRKHSRSTVIANFDSMEDPNAWSMHRNVDMLYVCSKHFAQENFGGLVELNFTRNGVGRAGEVKFMSYRNMFYDTHYGAVFSQWFQLKTLKTNPTCFIPDYEHPELCSLFSLGCYWACSNGLARPDGIGEPKSPQRRRALFVFPDLQKIKDSSVAGRITSHLRQVIPETPRPFFTGKSIRYGTMTQLTWDPAVTYEEAIALGGWTTNSNRDWYVWQYLVAIMPPALALAGYPDCRVLPYSPTIGILFRNLFVMDLPDFRVANTAQRAILLLVTATLIMHFDWAYTKFGSTHAYCRRIIGAMQMAGVPFADTKARSINLLQKWSKLVKADFKRGNSPNNENRREMGRRTIHDHLAQISESAAQLIAFKTEQTDAMQRMHDRLDELAEQVSKLVTRNDTMLEVLDVVVTQNRNLQLRLNEFMRHQNVPITELPETPQNLRRSQVAAASVARHVQRNGGVAPALEAALVPPLAATNAPAAEQVTPAAVAPVAVLATVVPTAAPVAPTPDVPVVQNRRMISVNDGLQRHRANPSVRSRGQMNKNQSLEKVLLTAYQAPGNPVYSKLRNGSIALVDEVVWFNRELFGNDRQQQQKIERILRCVDAMWTLEERRNAIEHLLSDEAANRYFDELTERVKLFTWRVKKIATYRRNNDRSKLPTSKTPSKATKQVLGMSNALGNYDLAQYIPKFGPNHTILRRPRMTLMGHCEEIGDELEHLIASN